jgi:acyl carrier protein
MSETAAIREFIKDNFMMGEDSGEIDGNDSLLDKGIIDSTGVLELVTFVEETFGFEVEDSDVVPENFDTIDCLVSYVRRKSGGHHGGEDSRGSE